MNASTTTTTTNGHAIVRPVRPAADIVERAEDWLLILDMPGADETQLEVLLQDRELRISAPILSGERDGERRVQAERIRGVYTRSFRLGEEADADGIDAAMRHGVLTVLVRKTQKALPRRIPVRTSDEGAGPAIGVLGDVPRMTADEPDESAS